MQQIADLLKNLGIKVTPQRLAIYNVLHKTSEHPSAEKIYRCLQDTHPTMSLATVYKTLDAFKKANLVQELNTGDDCVRYDALTQEHPHTICTGCGKIQDLDASLLDGLLDRIQKETDYSIDYQKVYFYGKCPQCK
ncbi:MAG: transcriptional repressor [Firmicutes bacterium HGW-Firmicutes-7]|nr:MAG: transcriptional repressor [Firmicutes bacterium HGW-Firmicutes-7]